MEPTPVPVPDFELPPLIQGIPQSWLTLIVLGILAIMILSIALAPLAKRRSLKSPQPISKVSREALQRVPVAPYQLKSSVLTKAELSFYHVLRRTVKDNVSIFPQTPISAIFYPQTGDHRLNGIYHNKINRKTVDFLLCDAQTLAPLVGIELDDKSHTRPDRIERDTFVDSVFEHGQLPLIRIPARSGYNLARLTEDLTKAGIGCNMRSLQVTEPET